MTTRLQHSAIALERPPRCALSKRSLARVLVVLACAESTEGCGGKTESTTGDKQGTGGVSGSSSGSHAHQAGSSVNGGSSGSSSVDSGASTGGIPMGGASSGFGGTFGSGSGGAPLTGGLAASGGTRASGGVSQSTAGSLHTGGASTSAGSYSAWGGGGTTASLGGSPATGGTVTVTGGTASSATGGGCSRPENLLSDFESGKGTLYPVPYDIVDGFWYVFSDAANCGSAAQAPLPVSGAATPAQLLPTDDPRRSDCNQYAMHSSIDNCSTFSGFGAVLAPFMDGIVNNMPVDLSAYDGLSFWIKAGSSGTTGPIFVEVLDTGCVPPSPDGSGVATNVATDRYNCHGALLKTLTTEWQQVFIPFGTLGPRWIPTRYAGNNPHNPCSSNDFCEVPTANLKAVLGIQFSLEDPWTKLPQSATNYDVWVDDVAFYKFSDLPHNSGLATWVQTGAYAFPQNRTYPHCAKPPGADGRLIQNAYDEWKRKFIVADGSYVRAVNPDLGTDAGNATYAESIAYGLLLSVYLGDQTLFDGLLGYWKMHSVSSKLSMLMRSVVNSSITAAVRTQSSADEDAAFALQMAVRQWGSDYQVDADTILAQFLANDIDANDNLKPSNDATGNAYPQSPGYFAPAYYKYFAAVDPGHAAQWNGVVTKGYAQLADISETNGLVPGWCVEACSRRGGGYEYVFDNFSTEDYQYDAHHTPWRIGLDRCWNDDANAKLYLDALTAFFVSASATGLSSLGEIYTGDGTPELQTNERALYYNSMSLIGGIGVGAMAVPGAAALRDRTWRFLLDAQYTRNYLFTHGESWMHPWRDFRNTTFGLIALLTLSGNFYLMP